MGYHEKDININGITNLGKGLGSQIKKRTKKENPRIIVGHDYRSYSEEIKVALKQGLISTGCYIEDIGLSLSPMVYFAQFNLDADAVAMVTASHNENGWTGVKMGIQKGLTHAPEEMANLKDITLSNNFLDGKGSLKKIDDFKKVYIQDLIKNKLNKKIKAVFSLKSSAIGQETSRQSFAKTVGFNSKRLIIPQQTHSNNITFCESERKIPNCDGAFSDSSKNVCSIQVADCMPIYFAHKSEIVFGLIHAGWRGLVNGILSKSAYTLTEKKYNLKEFEILIGPSIQSC